MRVGVCRRVYRGIPRHRSPLTCRCDARAWTRSQRQRHCEKVRAKRTYRNILRLPFRALTDLYGQAATFQDPLLFYTRNGERDTGRAAAGLTT